jgi:phosphoribosylanthranilate isomerase
METKIKICDIRDTTTARFCAENGVDFIGLHQIRAPIPEETITLFKEIKSVAGSLKLVLVTRENNLEDLLKMCLAFKFDYVQIHFPIKISDIKDFKMRLRNNHCETGLIAVISAEDIENIDIHTFYKEVDFLLFDTSYHGGTGICSSDEIIKKIIESATGTNFFFAGGLNPYNVAEKIKLLNPFAVDVQSGVEIKGQKHIKDLVKILSFIEEVKSVT